MGEQAEDIDPRIGLILLDRYRIVKKLGEGGMGDVYEGVHELIGKRLAIKCMHADFAKNHEAVERFKREARAATSVGNAHIVDVSDLGELPDGSPFMVMEYLDGCEFAGLIEDESPLSVGRVCRIAIQVLEALDAAHQKGVVHRDMKPENIFVVHRESNSDFVKVLDFGISLMREKAEEESARMTKTGIAMGTPHYMSPEQAKGARDVDHRTDIYSCGVILYEALIGDTPFDASSLAVLLTQILTEMPEGIRNIRPDVPVALEDLILRSIAKDPDQRPQTAQEFADKLKPFVDFNTSPVHFSEGSHLKKMEAATALVPPLPPSDSSLAQYPSLANSHNETRAAIEAIKPKRHRALLIGLAAFAVLGAIAIPLLKNKKVVSKPVVTAPIKAAPTKVQAKIQHVQIVISASPSRALIFIDGKRYPNPTAASMPKSAEPVEVQIVLDGYTTRNEVAIFDRDHKQHFELVKIQPKAIVTEEKPRTKKRNVPKPSKKPAKTTKETRPKFRDTF